MNPQLKWDSKYEKRLKEGVSLRPNERLKQLLAKNPQGKKLRALDIAAGLGRNSLYLAELGYEVTALDVSPVAMEFLNERAQEQGLNLTAKTFNLEDLDSLIEVYQGQFNFVTITYYLQRDLLERLGELMQEGAYLFIETYYKSPNSETETISDRFKLEEKELKTTFAAWDILHFSENEAEGYQTLLAAYQG